MDEYSVKRLLLGFSIQAEIEGMKALNDERTCIGDAPGYGQEHFDEKAEELRVLASKHNDQL